MAREQNAQGWVIVDGVHCCYCQLAQEACPKHGEDVVPKPEQVKLFRDHSESNSTTTLERIRDVNIQATCDQHSPPSYCPDCEWVRDELMATLDALAPDETLDLYGTVKFTRVQ